MKINIHSDKAKRIIYLIDLVGKESNSVINDWVKSDEYLLRGPYLAAINRMIKKLERAEKLLNTDN